MNPNLTHEALTLIQHSNVAARTATVTATGTDLRTYKGVVKVCQLVGTVSGTSPTLDGKLQSSPDNSTWTDITGATFTQVTAGDSYQSIGVDLRKTGGYVRYVGTIAGTTPSFTMGVTLIAEKALI